ncbi:MAG: IS66 family transposase [Turicibacter sp.]
MSESEIIKVYQEGIQSVISLVQGLSTQISELSQTVSDLDARLKKLEKQSNQTSQNSSLPPSTDGFKKTKSLRQPSNKKTGGQVGHKGSTLKMVEDPDLVVTHHPQTCQGCGCCLENVEPQKTIRRQVFDLSPLNIQVTEHQALIKVCPNCYYKNEGPFPKHVTQPTQYGPHLTSVLSYLSHYQLIPFNRLKQLTQDIFRLTISQGTLVNMTKRFYELLETTEASIKENLLASSYLHLDETGCYVNGKRQWLHVTSNKRYTHYFIHEKRGSQAIEANGILPSFKGTVIHDHWTPYFKYDDCTHALCNVHHLREFKGIIEFENQQWAKDMTELLLEAKTYSEETEYPLPLSKIQEFEKRYQQIIEEGYRENPLKLHEKNTDSVRLLNRLSKRQEEVLEFLYQVEVPFDNNLAERDVRMTKTKQKISGCFRTEKGAHCFARIRGFISTCQKQGLNIIESIETILMGNTIQFS